MGIAQKPVDFHFYDTVLFFSWTSLEISLINIISISWIVTPGVASEHISNIIINSKALITKVVIRLRYVEDIIITSVYATGLFANAEVLDVVSVFTVNVALRVNRSSCVKFGTDREILFES